MFDNDFPSFTPEEECFEGLLNLIDLHPVSDNLVEIATVLLQPLQVGRQFIIPEVFAPNDAPLRGDNVGRNLKRDAFAVPDANQGAALGYCVNGCLTSDLFPAGVNGHVDLHQAMGWS